MTSGKTIKTDVRIKKKKKTEKKIHNMPHSYPVSKIQWNSSPILSEFHRNVK